MQMEKCLPRSGSQDIVALHKMYDLTLKLQSQIVGIIYDQEAFASPVNQKSFAHRQSDGQNENGTVTLTINEPLPPVKKLTEAIEEHWKAMLHSAINKVTESDPLPCFEKAFVEIEIVTPRGSDNSRVWDTSNRAIQVILNNLKGIFFWDDDMEHMAFSVVGQWGCEGMTIIRISDFYSWQRPTERSSI